MTDAALEVNPENQWRTQSPGSAGWGRSPRPGAAKKYFMVSADTHITPPLDVIAQRLPAEYRERLPRVEKGEDGANYMHAEGVRSMRIVKSQLAGEDAYRDQAGAAGKSADFSAEMAKRHADLDLDGVDAEVAFPNGPALAAFWTPDPHFAQAQFRAYNDWAAEVSRPYRSRIHIAACIATGDVASAVVEVQRAAKLGFDLLTLPTQPIPGSNEDQGPKYNHPSFEPLWAAIQDVDLTMTFHVGTRGDPRGARGVGGAIINRAKSHKALVEPISALCGSGIFERYPKLRFASVEAGIGWIPALLDSMDETYRKHHMWIRPKLKDGLPSDYFRRHGAATYQEDRAGLLLMEPYGLSGNFLWANDYPHHEGTFPHSAEAIERDMAPLAEDSRRKVLGLNAARLFNFEVPAGYTH